MEREAPIKKPIRHTFPAGYASAMNGAARAHSTRGMMSLELRNTMPVSFIESGSTTCVTPIRKSRFGRC